jgi:phospholipid-binding lipoprotein MlaA
MMPIRNVLAAVASSALAFSIPTALAEETPSEQPPSEQQAQAAPQVVTPQEIQETDMNDPFEGSNRFFFDVNQVLDDILLRPIAVVYREVLPDFARDSVRNFLNNLNAPVIFANDLLQGEGDRAGTTFLRFGINSTLGLGGLFDVAGEMGFDYHDEDFGQTLAVWGAGEGPYFYFPVMGPSNARDFTGFVVDRGFDPLTYVNWGDEDLEYVPIARTALNVIDLRARNIETLDEIERTSVDYYASIRSLYRQSRADAIRNGAPSPELPDFDVGGGVTPPSTISPNLGEQ